MNPLPEPAQLFLWFEVNTTSDGAARDRFEQFVSDLVATQWDDSSTVAARNHNDWGIDTFVGDLGGGDIQVWQSKYFREWQTPDPQQEIRDSFASAQKQAAKEGHRIVEWTLVVPAVLHPNQMQWFLRWAKKQEKETGTRLQLWSGDKVRQRLMSSETADVRREYFPHISPPAAPTVAAAAVSLTDDYAAFDDALFVRQLHEAGYSETSAACGMYFATDALRRDLEAKEAFAALHALGTVELSVRSVWETRFNEHAPAAEVNGQMPALYGVVIREVATVPDAPGLTLQAAHKQGAAHMLVEQKQAGWVTHWRTIAASHETKSGATTAAQAAVSLGAAERVEDANDGGSTETGTTTVSVVAPAAVPETTRRKVGGEDA